MQSKDDDAEGTGTYLDRMGAMYALPELGCQNGLQERAAQADADNLPGRPEQVRDWDSRSVTRVFRCAEHAIGRGSDVLPVATAMSSRETLAIIA